MIPYEDLGGSGSVLHFLHANGYPPLAYQGLLERLSRDYHVLAMQMRPLWEGADPKEFHDWLPLMDDLERFLNQEKLNNLIGVGHSMGGTTTLRLALRQPELFRSLVLIDPVLFPPRMILQWNWIYHLGLGYRLHPLARGALRRRAVFESQEAMFTNYRQKAVFNRIDDINLWSYVKSIAHLRPDGQFDLFYPPQWEARIYVTGLLCDRTLWSNLPHLKPPVLIIRGAESNTFWERTACLVQRKLPSVEIVRIPEAGHLVPLEKLDVVYNAMKEFLTT
jgi:pimeloyl-ACP methyl ester carboxylesterase